MTRETSKPPSKEAPISSPHASARRRIIAGGVAAGAAALLTLPAQWTRPVVQAILVPAHAQSTLPVTCLTDTIPGRSFNCESGPGCFGYRYELVNGCLVRTDFMCTSVFASAENGEIFVRFFLVGEGSEIALTVNFVGVQAPCSGVFISGPGPSQSLPMSISGEPFVFSFVIGTTATRAVFVSDITVAPA